MQLPISAPVINKIMIALRFGAASKETLCNLAGTTIGSDIFVVSLNRLEEAGLLCYESARGGRGFQQAGRRAKPRPCLTGEGRDALARIQERPNIDIVAALAAPTRPTGVPCYLCGAARGCSCKG